MTEPLSLAFNIAVLRMAELVCPTGFDVSDTAPATYQAQRNHIDKTGRICVWSGASDQTIFGDPEVNWAFRAWHDWTHYTYHLDFSDESEYAVYIAQCNDLRKVFGAGREYVKFCQILRAEIVGQLEYKNGHGEFPTDQRSFVENYIKGYAAQVPNCTYCPPIDPTTPPAVKDYLDYLETRNVR